RWFPASSFSCFSLTLICVSYTITETDVVNVFLCVVNIFSLIGDRDADDWQPIEGRPRTGRGRADRTCSGRECACEHNTEHGGFSGVQHFGKGYKCSGGSA